MKAIIIEDEPLAARNLQAVLDEIGGVTVLAILETVAETVEWFESNAQPDLAFMDIHLADGSSFEVFDRAEIRCPVIFTTAYDEYALKAFKVNSIDYLLKPIESESVRNALQKLKTMMPGIERPDELQKIINLLNKNLTYKAHFLVPVKGNKLIPLEATSIHCIYIENGIVKALCHDDRIFVLEYTLDELINMLNPQDFFRANRQFIIARKAIKDVDLWFNNKLLINLKNQAPHKIFISKAKGLEFKKWYTNQ